LPKVPGVREITL
jgi:serine/threonine protein kinase